MSKDFRGMFEAQLVKDGRVAELTAFREAADKLKGDWIAMQLFAFDALCNYKSIPNNNGTPEWLAYVATGSLEEWKKVRAKRLAGAA
jgi:hypothetical protein